MWSKRKKANLLSSLKTRLGRIKGMIYDRDTKGTRGEPTLPQMLRSCGMEAQTGRTWRGAQPFPVSSG